MSLQLTNTYTKAYVEILEIINWMGKEYKNKIPTKLMKFFEENKDSSYKYSLNNLNSDKIFLNETIILLALLEQKYWASDYERDILNEALKENEEKYQENLRILYNPDNLFKNRKEHQSFIEDENIAETAIIEYKEKNFLQKIFNKIINLFKRNN